MTRCLLSTAAGALAALAFLGCSSPPPRSAVVPVDEADSSTEMDSQDILTMTRKMAEAISRLSFANDSLPLRIVMKWVKNETTTMKYVNRIALARIRVQLQNLISRDRMVFLLEDETLQDIRADEGVAPRGGPSSERRVRPDHALMAAFYDHPTNRGVYYLCTFQLVHLGTGAIVWEDSYEVKRARGGS